jgi:uncharacterized phage protein (TIGR02218 family)
MRTGRPDHAYAVRCLRIVSADASITLRVTTWPRSLLMGGGQVYAALHGWEETGLSATASMSPPALDFSGVLHAAGVTRDMLLSGVLDAARAYVFETDWRSPVEDDFPLIAALNGKLTLNDDAFTIEFMGLTDALGQALANPISPSCTLEFGGQEFGGCHVDLGPMTVTGTLTSVIDSYTVRDSARGEAADWFGAGTLEITSGDNAGLRPLDIVAYAADGTITVQDSPYYPLVGGESYTMIAGCRKRPAEDCRDKFANKDRFRGFEDVPTSGQLQQIGNK